MAPSCFTPPLVLAGLSLLHFDLLTALRDAVIALTSGTWGFFPFSAPSAEVSPDMTFFAPSDGVFASVAYLAEEKFPIVGPSSLTTTSYVCWGSFVTNSS